MKKKSLKPPAWASVGDEENKHLSDLLSLASANYGRCTDWFLRHRETGIKNLAAILAAESALVGVALTQKGIPASFLVVLLTILACAAPVLAWLAVSSCRRAFHAALESVFLMRKVVWAMGLMSNVAVDQNLVNVSSCPGCADKTLYTPRWASDSLARTTEEFVAENFRNQKNKSKNTFFLTKLTIIVFGVSACALGLLGAVLVLLHRP